jgi:hypothetical protein
MKRKLFGIAGAAVLMTALVFGLAGCDTDGGGGGGGDPELAGTIHISTTSGGEAATGTVDTNTVLYAVWTKGADDPASVTYEWKRDGTAITGETGATLKAASVTAGSYTVTVSWPGYQSKTSAAVTVAALPKIMWNFASAPSDIPFTSEIGARSIVFSSNTDDAVLTDAEKAAIKSLTPADLTWTGLTSGSRTLTIEVFSSTNGFDANGFNEPTDGKSISFGLKLIRTGGSSGVSQTAKLTAIAPKGGYVFVFSGRGTPQSNPWDNFRW